MAGEGGAAIEAEPNVVVASEPKQSDQSWWDRVRGEGQQQSTELVKPGEFKPSGPVFGEGEMPEVNQQTPPPGGDQPQAPNLTAENTQTVEDEEAIARMKSEGSPPLPPGGGHDGDEGGRDREPPDRNSLEFDASPERGREIALKIKKWEGLLHAGKYQEVDWTELNQAYRDEVVHIEAFRRISSDVQISEYAEGIKPDFEPIPKVNVNNLKNADGTDFVPATELTEAYSSGTIDKATFIKQAEAYFKEAKRVGLLEDLNTVLESIWTQEVRVGIDRKMASPEIMAGIDQKITGALNSIMGTIIDRRWGDDQITRLLGVAGLYTDLARGRLYSAINNKDSEGIYQRDKEIVEEFDPRDIQEEPPEQKFWHIQQFYPIIEAQTPGEYLRAAETYIERLENTTTSPQKIIQQVEYFVTALQTSQGFEKVNSENPGFVAALVAQIESRIGFFGGDHSNELYHGDEYDAYLNFLNKDGKGPDRWLAAARILEGKVAAAIWELDNDPEWEVLFSMYGSRGQLSEYSFAQRSGQEHLGLHFEVMDLLIERMMGVTLKDRDNLDKVTSFMSDKKFTSMFDGLFRYDKVPHGREHGDANIKAHEKYKDIDDRRLSKDQRKAKRLGRIQLELQGIRKSITYGEVGLKRGQLASDLIKDPKDRKFFKEAWDTAAKAVEIALQIYGVSGEKSKRGGDAFIIDKVEVGGKEFQEFMPVHFAQKVVQFSETWTKIKYADEAEIWRKPKFAGKILAKLPDGKPNPNYVKNFRSRYRAAMVEIARTRTIQGIRTKGYEVVLEDADYSSDYLEQTDGERTKRIRGNLNKDGNFDKIAHLQDGETRSMMFKRPTEYIYPRDAEGKIIIDGAPEDELVRGPAGKKVVIEEVPVTFYIASHHPYGDWTGHTYWSYQEEDRQLLLSPTTFAEAKKIRNGELRPEDADSVAVQLLILDPSLKRVRRFVGKHSENRERKLTMAAVEASYQGHWRIARELYRAFYPKYGTPVGDIKLYYALQDFGGWRKLLESTRGQIGEDDERFARRGRRLVPDLHNPVAPLSEYVGQGTRGALGPLRMMDYKVYRSFGSMALEKFSANAKYGGKVRGALIEDADQEGNYLEALLLKLTNESDELQELRSKLPIGMNWRNPDDQHIFCNAIRKSFGRLDKYLKVLVVMESKTRNASGAADLEEVDILNDSGEMASEFESFLDSLPDISNKEVLTRVDLANYIDKFEEWERGHEEEFNKLFNEGTENEAGGIDEGSTSFNTGSGRHSARIFFDTFIDLMIDSEKRGGGQHYKNEKHIYAHIDDPIIHYDPTQQSTDPKGVRVTKETIRDWLFGKLVPT